jgi:hypothetical protein
MFSFLAALVVMIVGCKIMFAKREQDKNNENSMDATHTKTMLGWKISW